MGCAMHYLTLNRLDEPKFRMKTNLSLPNHALDLQDSRRGRAVCELAQSI